MAGDDIRQRDLSSKRFQDMEPEEKQEMERRFRDFMKRVGGVDLPGAEPEEPRKMRPWNPASDGRSSSS